MLLPDAYGRELSLPPQISPPKYGPVATVMSVQGPLAHHFEVIEPDKPWGQPKYLDNYDAIRGRMEYALQGEGRTVVMAVDSPGGAAVGIFDLVIELQAMAKVAGKKLITWVDGNCASAAYALALAGERVVAAPGTIVGSIGVIDPIADLTAQDRSQGVKWTMLTTGARKADGNPHVAVGEDTIKARQSVIDSLGSTFFSLVAERRGMKLDAVRALEAATYTAEQAKAIGLVDEIMTLDQLLASLASEEAPVEQKGAEMADYKEAVAALRKAAEGDDEDAKNAKKMLAAIEGEPEKKPEDEKAEGEEAPPEKKPEDDKQALAASVATVASLVDKRIAELNAQTAEQHERVALLASRPDLTEDTRKALAGVPIATLRDLVKTMPRAAMSPVAAARAALGAVPTVGAGTGGADLGSPTQSPEKTLEMKRAMGLVTFETSDPKNEPFRLVLGAVVPVEGAGASNG
jgi:ClpP class serine protease